MKMTLKRQSDIRWAWSIALVLVAQSVWAAPPSPLETVKHLSLESARAGRVDYYFAGPDQARAQAMARLVDHAALMYERQFDLKVPVSLAALGPDNWFSEFPGIPYAIPWVSISEGLLMLPSSLTQGVLIKGPDALADRRRVDFVALHEFGHLASKAYFRPAAPEPDVPVSWFDELLATFFAYAYVAQADPEWASAARAEWVREIEGFTPKVLSLDWRFMRTLPGPELSRTYGWYQIVLNHRAAEVYERHGIEWLTGLKSSLSWPDAADWTPEILLQQLDTAAPDLAAWARHFGSGGRADDTNKK